MVAWGESANPRYSVPHKPCSPEGDPNRRQGPPSGLRERGWRPFLGFADSPQATMGRPPGLTARGRTAFELSAHVT